MEYQDDDRAYIRPRMSLTAKVRDFAHEAYAECVTVGSRNTWDHALVREHTTTKLTVTVDRRGNEVGVRIQHPTTYTRMFCVSFNVLAPEDGTITCETLVPEPYKDTFRECFMTALVGYFDSE